MGINNLMGNPSALYARPALTSPMAQLTCLLPSHSTENITHIGKKVVAASSSASDPTGK